MRVTEDTGGADSAGTAGTLGAQGALHPDSRILPEQELSKLRLPHTLGSGMVH